MTLTRSPLLPAVMVAFGLCMPAFSQQYPSRPVRMIVPFAPGGGTDIVARTIALKASQLLGQTVVVDNRGGAGGIIGMEMIVRAVPDGYTVGIGTGSIATSAALTKLPYDPIKDVLAMSMIAETGYLLVVHPSLPVKNTQELIAYAKANPGKVTYGSSGTGGTAHLAGELLDLMAGTKMTHVPYKSSGPALSDMLGGQISMIYGSLPVIVPQMSSARHLKHLFQAQPPAAGRADGRGIRRAGLRNHHLLRADRAARYAEGTGVALAGDAEGRAAVEGAEGPLRRRGARRAGNRIALFSTGDQDGYREVDARGEGREYRIE